MHNPIAIWIAVHNPIAIWIAENAKPIIHQANTQIWAKAAITAGKDKNFPKTNKKAATFVLVVVFLKASNKPMSLEVFGHDCVSTFKKPVWPVTASLCSYSCGIISVSVVVCITPTTIICRCERPY